VQCIAVLCCKVLRGKSGAGGQALTKVPELSAPFLFFWLKHQKAGFTTLLRATLR